MSIFQ